MTEYDIDRLGLPRIYTSVLVDNGDAGMVPGAIAGYAQTRDADGVDTLHTLVELDHPMLLVADDPRDNLMVSIIGVLPEKVRL